VFGTLSDIYGRRAMIILAMSLFVAGSVLCALAPNMPVLILARGLQGLGGGGIMPIVQTVISDVVTPRERGQYQAYFSSVWMAGGIAGPVVGGVFAEHLHWSMIFWINLPLALAALALLLPKMKKIPVFHRRRKVDWLGGVLLMVDANAAYTAADATTLASLDAFDLMMIEQPLDYDDLVDHARLQASLRTPICLDESIKSPKVAVDAIGLGACRIINIKPGRMGGFSPSLDVHEIARDRGIPLWHGGMLESGIGRAHNLHLSTLPGFTLPGDVAASKRYFVPDLIDPPIDVKPDGCIDVPPGPGIGVVPVDSRLREATRRTERYCA